MEKIEYVNIKTSLATAATLMVVGCTWVHRNDHSDQVELRVFEDRNSGELIHRLSIGSANAAHTPSKGRVHGKLNASCSKSGDAVLFELETPTYIGKSGTKGKASLRWGHHRAEPSEWKVAKGDGRTISYKANKSMLERLKKHDQVIISWYPYLSGLEYYQFNLGTDRTTVNEFVKACGRRRHRQP